MKNSSVNSLSSFRAAIKTASKAARRKAFRKGLPVAISRNGQIVLVYKDREVIQVSKKVKSKK